MERRDWSLEAMKELIFIDSLDEQQKAAGLLRWAEKYIAEDGIFNFDLELKDLQRLSELFYKNIKFLQAYNQEIQTNMVQNKNLKAFLENS
ncbi:MAG: hypothetical protein ACNI3C_05775 [Candidatus Marinarcus sp.]|uniref:hypothetical protein n=1 Tax=Candidatus Marinarcus sp. TaxID=3100987 RepID=UPI003AFF69D6